MLQMKEWFLRRRKGVYYAVSAVSIVGNLVVLVGPSLQASLVLQSGVLQAAWSALPQVAEVVLHRSVLYILLNLIVARIVVKSGMLGGRTPGMPAKPDEFCLPSSYYVVRGLPWPAYSTYSTQSEPVFTDPSVSLQHAHNDNRNTAMVDVCPQTLAQNTTMVDDVCAQTPARQHPSVNKSSHDEQPKCAPAAPSLFTIEPLNELVQTTESYTLYDDQAAQEESKTLQRPLRKVATRAADLHRSMQATTVKESVKAEVLQKQKNEGSLQIVLAKKKEGGDVVVENGGEEDDNRLSRQEFNERVDTFISKFKRNLTMQRQDSFNRLLGLVGGGGDIRLIK